METDAANDDNGMSGCHIWFLRLLNGAILALGIGTLAVAGMSYSNGITGGALLTLLLVVGGLLFTSGASGILATYRKTIMTFYFSCAFFMVVFVCWNFVYVALNFDTLEEGVKESLGNKWNSVVHDLPEEFTNNMPSGCVPNSTVADNSGTNSADVPFEECYAKIKDLIHDNFKTTAIVCGVSAGIQLLVVALSARALGAKAAATAVKTVIDVGIGLVGVVILLVGIGIMSTSGSEFAKVGIPIILVGSFLLLLSTVFGCCVGHGYCTSTHKVLKPIALAIYAILFLAIIGIAVGCLAYEETVKEEVDQNAVLIHSFCDSECWQEIKSNFENNQQEGYLESINQTACHSTVEGDCVDVCEAPDTETWCLDIECKWAPPGLCMSVTDYDTREYIVNRVQEALNTLGWFCILTAVYLACEIACTMYLGGAESDSGQKDMAYGGQA